MRANRAVDFSRIKKELLDREELVAGIAKSQTRSHIGEAKNLLANIADFLQFLHMTQPFMGVIIYLCEEARDIVLAESIANTSVNAGIDELLQSLWLSDIDVERGKGRLVDTIKHMPRSKFLRNVVAMHLMQRVFWKHWRKQDRLALLNAADVSLQGVGQRQKTGELQRIIENLPDTEDLEV